MSTTKKLKRMKRRELLELLLVVMKENESLRKRLQASEGESVSEKAGDGRAGAAIPADFANVAVSVGSAGSAEGTEGLSPAEEDLRGEQVEAELDRVKYRKQYRSVFRSTVSTLIVVAAVAVLISTLWMPVLKIYGDSMSPTLSEGQIMTAMKTSNFESGDIIAFQYNNKILIKRYIAGAGDWVDIDEDGTVYVNGEALDEPYLTDKAFGECNLDLPYQVPESRIFVMGDNRSVSLDSRNTAVGCVAAEQIVGKVMFRIWPLSEFTVFS